MEASKHCKKCPNGSFVSVEKAPGVSHFDCKSCPRGISLLSFMYIREWFCARPRSDQESRCNLQMLVIALDNKPRFHLCPLLTENLISLAKITICYHLRE